MLSQNDFFTVKHLIICMHFSFAKTSFSVLNRAPLDVLIVLAKYFFLDIHDKCVFYQLKILIQQYTDVVQKILFISVRYFKICITKSFMWPCFLLPHPLQAMRMTFFKLFLIFTFNNPNLAEKFTNLFMEFVFFHVCQCAVCSLHCALCSSQCTPGVVICK